MTCHIDTYIDLNNDNTPDSPHRHLHHHLLDLPGLPGCELGHVAVVGEEDGKAAGAEAEGNARAWLVNVKSTVAGLVVFGRGFQGLEGAAFHELAAVQEELDVGVLDMGLVPVLVRLLRRVLAHDRLHPVLQQGGPIVDGKAEPADVLQRRIHRRADPEVQGDVINVVVNHGFRYLFQSFSYCGNCE